jgi:hypothetical protein
MVRIRVNGLRFVAASRIGIPLFILLIVIMGCANSDWEERTTFRAPTETEIREFGKQKGTILAERLYHDHAIILGTNFIYSLYYSQLGEQQAFGSSWGGGQEGMIKTAITRESNFIGIVIRDTMALREAVKMKTTFDDGTAVMTALDDRGAYIIDHPLGRWTIVTKTAVQLLSDKDEIVYEVPLHELQ